MQNDANVVHLTRVASEPSPNAGAGRLPVILVQVRDKAALQLKQALQALFDNADDTLFEMADRATSNLEQNAFFEAMRDLRLKRKSIERVYLQKVFEDSRRSTRYSPANPCRPWIPCPSTASAWYRTRNWRSPSRWTRWWRG